MRKGYSLERTIRLIEETLKENEDTSIHSNFRIKNKFGVKREIDVLVETFQNGVAIKVAIECKDYTGKVPVGAIDAFVTKCNDIGEITRKIFVSSNGYHKGAIITANAHGIELFNANNLSLHVIRSWFPLKQLGFIYYQEFRNPELYLEAEEDKLYEIQTEFDQMIIRGNGAEPLPVQTVLTEAVKEHEKELWALSMMQWMKLKDTDRFKPFEIQMRVSFTNCFIQHRGQNVYLFSIVFSMPVQFVEKEAPITGGRQLASSDGKLKAKTITIDAGSGYAGDIVVNNKNELNFFIKDEDGNTKKMEVLASYDPKTDKFTDYTS